MLVGARRDQEPGTFHVCYFGGAAGEEEYDIATWPITEFLLDGCGLTSVKLGQGSSDSKSDEGEVDEKGHHDDYVAFVLRVIGL